MSSARILVPLPPCSTLRARAPRSLSPVFDGRIGGQRGGFALRDDGLMECCRPPMSPGGGQWLERPPASCLPARRTCTLIPRAERSSAGMRLAKGAGGRDRSRRGRCFRLTSPRTTHTVARCSHRCFGRCVGRPQRVWPAASPDRCRHDSSGRAGRGGRLRRLDSVLRSARRGSDWPGPRPSAGFLQLEEFPDGAFLGLAKAEYTGEYRDRRGLVQRLGLTPRRMMGRNPKTGEPIEVNWCL